MNTVTESPQLQESKHPDFIKIQGQTFAEYTIIYHINDCYAIDELSKFRDKHQLLFQKFKNNKQQFNLALLDSRFPNIVADLALDVFLNNVTSFNDYILSKKSIIVIDTVIDEAYFKYKFFLFIHYLLYSDIASTKTLYKGEVETNKVFCIKNANGEIDFYSIYDQNKLQLLLLNKMKLEIDTNASSISKTEVRLCFKISGHVDNKGQ